MKVVGGKYIGEKITISIQVEAELLKLIDKLARDNHVARQKLIIAILKTAMEDPGFTVDLKKV